MAPREREESGGLKAERLYLLAQGIAVGTPHFFDVKGAGDGDRATNLFMSHLRKLAKKTFGKDYSEKQVCQGTKLAFDFYFPDEECVVEVAFGLRNPNSEFERDIFKCLLAIDVGLRIKRLLFISKPGALPRQNSPASKAIMDYVRHRHGLQIETLELEASQVSARGLQELVCLPERIGGPRS